MVGNDVDADGKPLVIITGANRGGKSTFLCSVGLAQLMLQCGLFVTADAFSSSLRSGLCTHYKREEDRNMRSGKFDEQLVRMSDIADRMHRRALVLFNDSFAATHEREGSEIARQIVSALLDNDVTVFFVTHMFEFARSFVGDRRVRFLQAERDDEGARSFPSARGPAASRRVLASTYIGAFSARDERRSCERGTPRRAMKFQPER